MSLSRRATSIWRLHALCAPESLGSLGNSTATAITASSLNLLPNLFSFSSNNHHHAFNNQALQFSSIRNFSATPFNNNSRDDNAAPTTTAEISPLEDVTALEAVSPDSIVDLTSIAEKAALEAAAEGVWAPTRGLQWILETVHESTGLPWWSTIIATTFGIRSLTFPVMLMQIKNTHRLSQARPEVEALVEHLKEEQARGNPNAVSEYQTRVAQVWAKYNANPLKSVATLLVQAPLFIGFFSALRGLAAAKVPSLLEGGTFWFTDLTVADPTYALPLIASATFLLTVEVGAADGMEGQPDAMKKKMKNIMRLVAVGIVPFTASMPASVFMYWASSNLFSLLQTMVLKIPGVKPALGIPVLKGVGSSVAAEPGKPVATFTQKPKPAVVAPPVAPAPKIKPGALKKRK